MKPEPHVQVKQILWKFIDESTSMCVLNVYTRVALVHQTIVQMSGQSLNPVRVLIISLSNKLYSHCPVLVGSRNGFRHEVIINAH